jgi:hypothetical protein
MDAASRELDLHVPLRPSKPMRVRSINSPPPAGNDLDHSAVVRVVEERMGQALALDR